MMTTYNQKTVVHNNIPKAHVLEDKISRMLTIKKVGCASIQFNS